MRTRKIMKTQNIPKSSYYFLLCVLAAVLLLAMTPLTAMATSAYVEVDSYPGPGFNPNDVTINVGESVHWQHVDLTGSTHWIRSSDYEGRLCYDSTFVGGDTSNNTNGNTEGLLIYHEDYYTHFFPAPGGDCYYRCIL